MTEKSNEAERYWQQCEIPDCLNEVPKAKAICNECTGGGLP